MCQKDANHNDNIYPHLVLEVTIHKFVAVPFSSSYDCFGEKVLSEKISKRWGNRSRDGWIAANRIQEFTLTSSQIVDYWGYIPQDAAVWKIVWKVIRRYHNYLRLTGRKRPPFLPKEQRGYTVQSSSYEKYAV